MKPTNHIRRFFLVQFFYLSFGTRLEGPARTVSLVLGGGEGSYFEIEGSRKTEAGPFILKCYIASSLGTEREGER